MTQLAYFGTDGIRGRYGERPITESFFYVLGQAVVAYLRAQDPKETSLSVVLGHDTRACGTDLSAAFCCALERAGVFVKYLGVAPTPSIAFLTRHYEASLGVSVTASHNPATDNGIKFFNAKGLKLTVDDEALIEKRIQAALRHQIAGESLDFIGQYTLPVAHKESMEPYEAFASLGINHSLLSGTKVVLDTANGATYTINPKVLRYLGAELVVIGNEPDGTNINQAVGSECPELMAKNVLSHGAALGIAHDGDGDRVIFCDEHGSILDGDEVIGILALDALRRQVLNPKLVVVTIHSNTGLDAALKGEGVEVIRTDVGDRNVLYALMERKAYLGGESSGHIIFPTINPAGDGLIAALQLMQVLVRTQQPLSKLRKCVNLFPKVTANLEVFEKKPMGELRLIPKAIHTIQSELKDKGRVLVRYSGTEPKIRLLVEGEDISLISRGLKQLEEAVAKELQK